MFFHREKRNVPVWYNQIMIQLKKETFKEIGKYLLDISKILIALTLVGPLVKGEAASFVAILLTAVLAVIGIYLTDKGVKDE